MKSLWQELRVCIRQLRRSPAFTIAAVLTLAVGIGANTAVFTLLENILLAPLPYRDAQRIVAIETRSEKTGRQSPRVTGGDVVDLRAQSEIFEYFSTVSGGEVGVQLADHSAFTGVMFVNSDLPRIFGIKPVFGRLFIEKEAKTSALVSQAFAQNNFGEAQKALGQRLSIDDEVLTIVGVLPNSFNYPSLKYEGSVTQVWAGSSNVPENLNRTAYNYRAVAKLRDGVSIEQAQARLGALGKSLEAAYPDSNHEKTFRAVPLREQMVGKSTSMLWTLMGAVVLILLIACVNLANLQFARATTRFREVAVRSALGATRFSIARMVLVESLLLSLLGAMLGIVIAEPLVRGVVALAPSTIPRVEEIQLNPMVLAFTLVVALFTTAVAGAASLVQLWRVDLNSALKQDARRGTTGRRALRFRSALVIGEVALTLMLAVAAGLLARTMQNLNKETLGYRTDRMLVTYVHAQVKSEAQSVTRPREMQALMNDLATLPGVENVAGVMGLPTGRYGSNGSYEAEGKTEGKSVDDRPEATFTVASPRYFSTLGVPVLRGREFKENDTYESEPVAIISESLARETYGSEDPIGRRIRCGLDSPKWMTVVGVVRDVKQASPASTAGATLYMPLTQHPTYANEIQIVMRTKVNPVSLIETVQGKIRSADPSIAMRFTTMDEMVGESIAAYRFRTYLIGGFAGLGLLLAFIGVYGVVAYTVEQRTFEVGVRMTFGARPSQISGMIVKQASLLALGGVILGAAFAMGAAPLLASMLFGVKATDPMTMLAACVLILLSAVAAAYIPARRAAAMDPLVAIRYE
jgi:putative ABC transport system permease protein